MTKNCTLHFSLSLSLSLSLHLVEIHLYNAFLAQARYLGSNVEVEIHFDNAFLLQARYLSSNAEVEIFCRSPYSYPLVCLLLRIEVYEV